MKRTFLSRPQGRRGGRPGRRAVRLRRQATVSCGETLTKSTTLANDLVDCPVNGLVVGANGITIDLNGHTIDGTNARTPGTGGIANDGHRNVTIENGTITDFYYSGVVLGPHNVVTQADDPADRRRLQAGRHLRRHLPFPIRRLQDRALRRFERRPRIPGQRDRHLQLAWYARRATTDSYERGVGSRSTDRLRRGS